MTTENQKGTLAADLTALLASGVGADTTLVAGDTCLPAHRAVLMARSPFFRSTFSTVPRGAHSIRVVLDGVEPEVAKQLLAFVYGDEAPQLGGTAAQLLQAADKYGLPVLKARCGRHLAQQLSVENAAATAVLSLQHGCGDLADAAVTFIRENALQVMFSDGWAQALHRHPQTMAKISLLAGK